MIKYVQYKDSEFTEINGNTIKIKTVDYSVKKASLNPNKTGVYGTNKYNAKTHYPANYRKEGSAFKYSLIPIDWLYWYLPIRIIASQHLLFSNNPEVNILFGNLLSLAYCNELPVIRNHEDNISLIYIAKFSPSSIKQKLLDLQDKWYKFSDGNLLISETKEDDSWKCAYGDPHQEGLLLIQNLELIEEEK